MWKESSCSGWLGMYLLCTTGCMAQVDNERTEAVAKCEPEGQHLRYVLTEYLDPGVLKADLDGDGKPENWIIGLLLLGPTKIIEVADLKLGAYDVVNSRLASGRGGYLLDVQAPEDRPGCAAVTLYRAAERESSGEPWKVALGSPVARLRGWGTHSELRTILTPLLTAEDQATTDLYLPLAQTGHLMRLHGAQLSLRRVSPAAINAELFGVIRASDVDASMWGVLARETTRLIPWGVNLLGEERVRARIGSWLASLEAAGRKARIAKPDAYNCQRDLRRCVVLPAELKEYYADSYRPDLHMYDDAGVWHPDPEPTSSVKDSFSIGFAFQAKLGSFEQPCPSGQFCTQSVELAANEGLLAGWATRQSELWLLTDRCRALLHDGMRWTPYVLPDCQSCLESGEPLRGGAIFGAQYDEVWASVAPGRGWLWWDGVRWRNPLPTGCSDRVVLSIHGSDVRNIWALAAEDTRNESSRSIWRYNGSGFLDWQRVWPSLPNRQVILSLEPNAALMGGYGSGLTQMVLGANLQPIDSESPVPNTLGLAGNTPQNVWALTGGSGSQMGACFRLREDKLQKVTGIGCEVTGTSYLSAWMDRRGILWASGEKGLLRRYDTRGTAPWQDIPHDAGPQARISRVFGAAEDGAVWALVEDHTLLRYQP